MFPILSTEWLAPEIKRLVVKAPRIARRQQPGQFVIVRVHDHGERIPLTISDTDSSCGSITLIVQGVGKTTKLINSLTAGTGLLDVVGPLGNPSRIQNHGTVVVIGGGVGAAIAFPTARALRAAGNRVLAILGARSRELVILERELGEISDELHVVTNDGTKGEKGVVTDPLRRLLAAEPVDLVLAIGPIPMMRAVAETTRPHRIHTIVSLNSIMVDGTGMCGGCRVLVGEQPRFACVDGPEFDAHRVDFDSLEQRNRMYRDSEELARQAFAEDPGADLRRVEDVCRLAALESGIGGDGEDGK